MFDNLKLLKFLGIQNEKIILDRQRPLTNVARQYTPLPKTAERVDKYYKEMLIFNGFSDTSVVEVGDTIYLPIDWDIIDLSDYVIAKVGDMIKNYCQIDNIPPQLDNIYLNMCMSLAKAENIFVSFGYGVDLPVSSITRGDLSISYANTLKNAYGMADSSSTAPFLQNWTAQLQPFRQLNYKKAVMSSEDCNDVIQNR